MIIYLDSLLVLNLILDYLLLLATAKIGGRPAGRLRLFGAAAMGAMWCLTAFLPGEGFGLPGKLLAGAVMTVTAFGINKNSLRLGVIFMGISLTVAGAAIVMSTISSGLLANWELIYLPLDMKTLIFITGITYAVLSIGLRGLGCSRRNKTIEVAIQGRRAKINCLLDTGNSLRDPISGEKILVLDSKLAGRLIPGLESRFLTEPGQALELIRQLVPEAAPRLIPYRTVGERAFLVAVRCRMIFDGREKTGLAAFSRESISENGSFEAILSAD